MAWNLPSLPTTGTIATVANWATKVIDCLRFLKGLDGTVTLSDGLDLGTNELTINSIEIVGVDGEVNKAAVEDHTHADAANCGTIDHGALTGKADDDHTQYVLRNILTTRGDLFRRGASAIERVALGTSGQVLRSDGTDAVWGAGVAGINSGTYAGNDTANRAIAHGLGVTPKIVFIQVDGQYWFRITDQLAKIHFAEADTDTIGTHTVTAMGTTNFYVGNATSYTFSANATGWTYYWVAIG